MKIRTGLPKIDTENLVSALGLNDPAFAVAGLTERNGKVTITIDDKVFGPEGREWVIAELRVRAIKAVQAMARTWDSDIDGPPPNEKIHVKWSKNKRK